MRWFSSRVPNAYEVADTRNLRSLTNTLLTSRCLTCARISHIIKPLDFISRNRTALEVAENMKKYFENEKMFLQYIDRVGASNDLKNLKWSFFAEPLEVSPTEFLNLKKRQVPEAFFHEFGGFSEIDLKNFQTFSNEIQETYLQYLFIVKNLKSVSSSLKIHQFQTLYNMLLFRQLQHFPDLNDVLEIGPGSGWQTILFSKIEKLRNYSQVEVFHPLYEQQNFINNKYYAENYVDYAQLKQQDNIPSQRLDARTLNHFPWWRIPDAFETSYDLVMMNECIAEMPVSNFRFYIDNVIRSLKRNGFLMIFGVGSTQFHKDIYDRIDYILEKKFKILLFCPNKSPFHHAKFIFVKKDSDYAHHGIENLPESFMPKVPFIENLVSPAVGARLTQDFLPDISFSSSVSTQIFKN